MRTAILVALMGLAGCASGGIEQAEYDKVVKERDQLRNQVGELKTQVTKLKKGGQASKRMPPGGAIPKEKIDSWLKEAEITRDSKLEAVIKTSQGDITCELFAEKAPLTVANFVGLADGKKEWTDPKSRQKTKTPLYNGTIFHRVIKGFMIQGGDPLGSGRGGPGYKFEDEARNGLTFDKNGILAMANSGPNTNGSQFFVTFGRNPSHLNGKHTIFGQCDTPVVEKIMDVEKGRGDRPTTDVVIESIAINRK